MKFRGLLRAMVVMTAIGPALAHADLNPGDFWFNPSLSGTGVPGTAGPFYTTATPAWVTTGTLVASLTGPMVGDFVGNIYSEVRDVGGGRLGFIYTVTVDGPADLASGLVRVAPAIAGWAPPLRILDAGSDGTGSTRPRGGPESWSDGDAYFIERNFTNGAPAWQFAVGANGTELRAGHTSARIWFETDATYYIQSFADVLDSGLSAQADILAPSMIPEPAGVALGAIGLAMLARSKRRLA
ncbi:MAG: hypothetical protein AB7Q17_03385 [Phycisphaerae bacterium]